MWPSNPRLMYIGMQDQWFTFNMVRIPPATAWLRPPPRGPRIPVRPSRAWQFDAQAWYARDLILGRLKLPDAKTMADEWARHRAEEEARPPTDEASIRYQGEYVKHLGKMTDYPTFDVDAVCECFLEWEHNKHTDIMTFRDRPHRSIMTGTMAPVHHTPWLTCFDDSIASYVQGNRDKAAKL